MNYTRIAARQELPNKFMQSPPSLAQRMPFVLHVCCIVCELGSLGSIGLWLNHT